MALVYLSVLNLLLGGALGRRFAVAIIIPLVPVVLVEVWLFGPAGGWIAACLSFAMLMVAFQVGYLVGTRFAAARSGREPYRADDGGASTPILNSERLQPRH